jgi:hypothetical protein
MASDRLVTSQHVLKAVMEHERRGATRILAELEKLEPDLLEYLLEAQTRLYHRLTHLGLSGTDARKIHRHAEKTTVVCIMALRKAHHDLWKQDPAAPEQANPDSDPHSVDPPAS